MLLGLIDPVDRSAMVDVPPISHNVSATALARRVRGVDNSWPFEPADITPNQGRFYPRDFHTDHPGIGTSPDYTDSSSMCFDTDPRRGIRSPSAERCYIDSRAVFPWLLECARHEHIPV